MGNFILIDDDQTNIFIMDWTIKSVLPMASIKCFINPIEALSFLSEPLNNSDSIIFIDINMPEMTGWELLDKIKAKKLHCRIFMLTSSIDPKEIEVSNNYSEVENVFSKPLTVDHLNQILKAPKS